LRLPIIDDGHFSPGLKRTGAKAISPAHLVQFILEVEGSPEERNVAIVDLRSPGMLFFVYSKVAATII